MVFEGCNVSNLPEMEVTSIHKRSKSFPEKREFEGDKVDGCGEPSERIKLDMGYMKSSSTIKKKQLPNAEVRNSLRHEILHLEKRLQDQVATRGALEKALGYKSSSHDIIDEISIPKPATELIKEIAVLEFEVGYLEQYLLSLYRKAFDQQVSCRSPPVKDERTISPLTTSRTRHLETSKDDMPPLKQENSADLMNNKPPGNSWNHSTGAGEDELLDSGVHRCHSSLSQRSALSSRQSPPIGDLGKTLRACYSQPLSMMEFAHNSSSSSNIISLAEHLGTRISDHIPETPNKLSEDMIKCMAAIYCKLADPPLTNHGLSSPTSSLSSMSTFSPKDHSDLWSPGFRRDSSSFDVRLDNPFHVQGLKEFSGPYSTMVEVQCIYRDSQKLGNIEHMLRNFKSLISRLEGIDPRNMKHEEKLAFWINVHNALVMHAFLAYGIPQNSVKRVFLLLKAAYNVGGHVVSADAIQTSVLGCRMSRPGQWLRLLLASRTKFKAGDERQAYAIDHPEPLLHFALCSGSHSDPAVRVYTPKRIFQELEAAKEEFVRATFGVSKDQKIILPKIVESFAKDSDLCTTGIIEMVQHSLPESLRKSLKKRQLAKSRKNIEWAPHNFTFRYLISKELVK